MNMASDQNHSIKGDRALRPGDEDTLGFREVAKRIATALVDRASEDGFVIGVEGAWGSGKSSLLFLIGEELGKLPDDRRPAIINFKPWLIGNRDALISSLFSELSNQLDQIALNAGDATPISVAKARKALEALRSFTSALSHAGAVIEVAGDASGFGPLKWVGKGIKAAGEFVGKKPAPPQLSDLKDKLGESLRELGHRFVVTIDDVDRLEPTEVIEILRLVRSVVDLPNVIYLLCYDSITLAHSIEKAVGVSSGQSYLEKIVQLTVMVPKPEELQLRQWFTDELRLIASTKNDDELSRLKVVIDYEGGRQLQTPRSVVRVLDAVRFFWPPLREMRADLADFVWLQLIKDGNPKLFRWIEGYCACAAVISVGIARLGDGEKDQRLAALHETVGDNYFEDATYRYNFSKVLPGVEADYYEAGNYLKIFQQISDQDRSNNIQNKRLASPDHYKLYFSMTDPSHALTQYEATSMWSAAEDSPEQAGAELLHLHNRQIAGSLTKADLILERIRVGAYKVMPSQQCENILLALSQIMDVAYRHRPFDLGWVNSVWDRAQRLIPFLLLRLDPTHRALVISQMFSEGAAIGWLTSLFRYEMFAHGRIADNRRRIESEWLFKDQELDKITDIMLSRYKAMSVRQVFAGPNPTSLLFAWLQAGDETGPRQLVQESIISDEGFIETLEHLTTNINSSDRGTFEVLKEHNLSPFLDFGNINQRLQVLERHSELGERAKRLTAALEDGADY